MKSNHSLGRWAVVALAAVGCYICVTLVNMSVGDSAKGASGLGASLCTPSEAVNCDYVLASKWAKIGPMPVAALGVMYFGVIGAWFVAVGIPNGAGRRWHGVPGAICAVGLTGSAFFVYVMLVSLPVWCTWCLAAHGVNLVVAIVVFMTRPRRSATEGTTPGYPSMCRALGTIAGCGGATVMIFLAVFAYQLQIATRRMQLELMAATNNAAYVSWKLGTQTARAMQIRPGAPSMGPEGAAHTLVAFTDFECRHCGWFHDYAERLGQMFPKELRIVFLHAPMCRECNPAVTKTFHYFACEAARAAEAAQLSTTAEKARAYRTLLYRSADEFASRPYAALARTAGIEAGAFQKMLDSEASIAGVKADVALANELGVEGTPSIWLDGRKLSTWHIMSDEPNPKISVTKTDEMWRELLGESAAGRAAAPAAETRD